jgi:ureidoacrylate peracid hydrolase
MRPLPYGTLRETVSPDHTALLVIDVQNDFCKDAFRKAIVPAVGRVREHARQAGVLVAYVQNTVLPDGLSDSPADLARRQSLGISTDVTVDGTAGHRFVSQIEPRAGEPVVRKHRLNGFINTTLDTVLRSSGIETIVCVGSATHGCVINTAYAGIALNYYVVVAADCVASWRADLHEAALFLMRNTVNYVVESSELARLWELSGAR